MVLRWGKDTNDSPETHVSHNVTNFEFLYEPFYVASDLVPIHDERFMGYGFTRNSQVSFLISFMCVNSVGKKVCSCFEVELLIW